MRKEFCEELHTMGGLQKPLSATVASTGYLSIDVTYVRTVAPYEARML